MRAYTSNILPTDAAFYTLNNAYIVDNALTIVAGGSAHINITSQQLAALTEYFRVAAHVTPSSSDYAGQISITVQCAAREGTRFSHYCNVVTDASDLFETEIEVIDGEYDSLSVHIAATVDCTFTFWELCPQLEDSNIYVEIEGVRQSLPRLLYDYNTTNIIVQQSEQQVAMINSYLLDDTDLQGHFTMNCDVSERSTIYLRFYDNNMIELFSPLLFTVNPGMNTLSVPHAYLHKFSGIHNFYVTAQTTNGFLTVPIRGALYTIDGGYLLSRLMNPDMDLRDLSLKRLITDVEPSEIWGIGIDNDIILVKKRSYDFEAYNEVWTAQFTLGHGTEAAIEFDGAWQLYNSLRNLVTEEVPWVFWITEGNLLAQRGSNEATRFTLATGTTKVAAIRGWLFNDSFADNDMGLIVAYIKNDGLAYYRQYRTPLETGVKEWVTEELIPFTSVNLPYGSISVNRVNDYRVAFSIHDSQNASFSIFTERYYQADSVEPLRLLVYPSPIVLLAHPVYPTIVSFYNISNFETIVILSHAPFNPEGQQGKFVLRSSTSVSYSISSTELYEDDPEQRFAIKLTHSNYMHVVNPVTLTFTNTTILSGTSFHTLNEGSVFIYANSALTLDVIDYTPRREAFASDDLIVATVNTPSLTVTPIGQVAVRGAQDDILLLTVENPVVTVTNALYHAGQAANDMISLSTITATVTLTHVGVSPL